MIFVLAAWYSVLKTLAQIFRSVFPIAQARNICTGTLSTEYQMSLVTERIGL